MHRFSSLRSNIAALAVGLGLALLLAGSASAADLIPIGTTGHDQDIFFENSGTATANGELGSRQFFEEGVFADGVPRNLPTFVSPVTGNNIDFTFNAFEQNNIIKLDTVNVGPKTLTLDVPNEYGQLAFVVSGGSLATTTEFAVVPFTINYSSGAPQTGELQVPDWGAATPELTPNTVDMFNADRTTANVTALPIASDNNTTANRWSISVQEIATTQPTVNIVSVTFGTPQLNQNGTVVPLIAGDDVVIYGLAGSGEALVSGDTDGDGTVELSDFDPIRNNFRKPVTLRSEGDLVRNGTVDFNDFRQWKTAFLGAGGSVDGLDLSLAAVPEPAACVLFSLAATFAACVRRQRYPVGQILT